MVITGLVVFTIDENGGGLTLIELAEGVTLDEIRAKTGRMQNRDLMAESAATRNGLEAL